MELRFRSGLVQWEQNQQKRPFVRFWIPVWQGRIFSTFQGSERVEEHRELIFSNYDERKREFIDFVLSKYEEDGVDELSPDKLPVLLELKYDTLRDASDHLGSMNEIRETFVEFQEHLYACA